MSPKSICLSVTSLCLLGSSHTLLAEDWQYAVNAGVANAPRYSGSDERMTAPLLGGKIISPWGVFLDTSKGLGWGHEGEDFSFSVYGAPSAERKDSKKSGHLGSDKLRGMGDIKSRAQFGVSGSYTLGPVKLGATLEHALKEDNKKDQAHKENGLAYTQLELSIGTNLYEGRFGSLDASLNSRFGDRNYLQTWYGVTAGQASRTSFKAYDAKGGMISNGLNLVWSVPIDENISFATMLDMQYLAKEAGKSPIVDRRLQTAVMGQIEYSF